VKPCDDGFYKYWFDSAIDRIFKEWPPD